jgi:hypothetical protein
MIRRINNFEVLFYHGRNGRITNNALDDQCNLRPTQGQTNALRRPKGIMYAKIACDVRCDELHPSNISMLFPFSFDCSPPE